MQRMDSCYIGQRMRNLELRGRRERGRPQRWFMDAVKISLLTGRVLQQNQVQGRAAMCCEQPKVGWGWVGEWKEEESTETQGQNTNYRQKFMTCSSERRGEKCSEDDGNFPAA